MSSNGFFGRALVGRLAASMACGAAVSAGGEAPPPPCRVHTGRLPSSPRRADRLACLPLLAIAAWAVAGCTAHNAGSAADIHRQEQKEAQQEAKEKAQEEARAAGQLRDSQRQELELVPPPSKSLYLAVHERDAWANPFLIVGRDMVSLRVVYPDANTSSLGSGGMLRPASARRQDLDLRIADLPAALSALPENAWPYGRVVAIEEAGTAAKADRPQIRRNVEKAIQDLNDLGIVVDEWTGNSGSLLR